MEKKFSSRFKAYNSAIGDKNCNLDLNFGSETSELASFSKDLDKLSFVNHKNNKKIEVKVITLDTFFEKFNITYAEKGIDLLKIDTEGYEFSIINGLLKNINKIKVIHFEHHYDDMVVKNYKFGDIHSLLIKNNFKQYFKIKMKFRKSFEYIYYNKSLINKK